MFLAHTARGRQHPIQGQVPLRCLYEADSMSPPPQINSKILLLVNCVEKQRSVWCKSNRTAKMKDRDPVFHSFAQPRQEEDI
jgi:hypothetical protein